MNLKVGDILIAKRECRMISSDEKALVIGKEYEIINIDQENEAIFIKSEISSNHRFPTKQDQKENNVDYYFHIKGKEKSLSDQEIKDYLKELITTNVDICNAVNKLSRKVKKLSKPSNYDLNNIFGDPVAELDKVFDCCKIQAGDKVVNEPKKPHFETLEIGQKIEFTLKNGKSYNCKVLSQEGKVFLFNLGEGSNDTPFRDLNQIEFKNNLNRKRGELRRISIYDTSWPEAPTLKDLINDLNTLIDLPDLTAKETPLTDLNNEVQLEKQAKELVKGIEQFTNGWYEVDSSKSIDKKAWTYNLRTKQIQATKASIEAITFILENDFSRSELEGIKGVLNGMA